jgi:hypothetical protein
MEGELAGFPPTGQGATSKEWFPRILAASWEHSLATVAEETVAYDWE